MITKLVAEAGSYECVQSVDRQTKSTVDLHKLDTLPARLGRKLGLLLLVLRLG
jgi:hypothetical protein